MSSAVVIGEYAGLSGPVELYAALAACFCLIESRISPLNQDLRGQAVFGIDTDADTCPQAEGSVATVEGGQQFSDDLISDQLEILRTLDIREDPYELITSVACDKIRFSDYSGNALSTCR